MTPCPVCQSADTWVAYPLIECDLLECRACSHCFSELRPGIAPEIYGEGVESAKGSMIYVLETGGKPMNARVAAAVKAVRF